MEVNILFDNYQFLLERSVHKDFLNLALMKLSKRESSYLLSSPSETLSNFKDKFITGSI
jgi:hypothetical protein